MSDSYRTSPFKDPYRQYNFAVELDSSIVAQFQEVSGLDVTTDVIEYREGNQNMTVRKLPGLTKFSNITLKKGITIDNQALWDWQQKAALGTVQRFQTIAIILMDDTQQIQAVRWELTDAWPTKWTGPDLNSTGNSVAVESIEIVHEGITKATYK
ncbi:MAG: phage tail protein [Phototrophicaceae bacterium]